MASYDRIASVVPDEEYAELLAATLPDTNTPVRLGHHSVFNPLKVLPRDPDNPPGEVLDELEDIFARANRVQPGVRLAGLDVELSEIKGDSSVSLGVAS